MSKGYGSVQRAVLARLESWPRQHQSWSAHSYATHAYPPWRMVADLAAQDDDSALPPTRAQVESVRRAVKQLAARGLAELDYQSWEGTRDDPRFGRLTVHREMLSVRPVLTDAERDAERAEARAASAAAAGRIAEMYARLRG
jgi:hypothetical protein